MSEILVYRYTNWLGVGKMTSKDTPLIPQSEHCYMDYDTVRDRVGKGDLDTLRYFLDHQLALWKDDGEKKLSGMLMTAVLQKQSEIIDIILNHKNVVSITVIVPDTIIDVLFIKRTLDHPKAKHINIKTWKSVMAQPELYLYFKKKRVIQCYDNSGVQPPFFMQNPLDLDAIAQYVNDIQPKTTLDVESLGVHPNILWHSATKGDLNEFDSIIKILRNRCGAKCVPFTFGEKCAMEKADFSYDACCSMLLRKAMDSGTHIQMIKLFIENCRNPEKVAAYFLNKVIAAENCGYGRSHKLLIDCLFDFNIDNDDIELKSLMNAAHLLTMYVIDKMVKRGFDINRLRECGCSDNYNFGVIFKKYQPEEQSSCVIQ